MIRIVGGPNAKTGRVEVFSKDSFPSNSWLPFCDRGFGEADASLLCSLMGYKFGRKYYSPNVTFVPPTNVKPLTDLSCTGPKRSLLTAAAASLADALGNLASGGSGGGGGGRRVAPGGGGSSALEAAGVADAADGGGAGGRRWLQQSGQFLDDSGEYDPPLATRPWPCTLATSGKGARKCTFRSTNSCGRTGPMAGIECSVTKLGPRPVLPPSPPSPPPPPISKLGFIRVVSKHDTELNLCMQPGAGSGAESGGDNTCAYGRVELLVPSPSNHSKEVWAPLCAVNSSSAAYEVAWVACRMMVDLPASKLNGIYSSRGELGPRYAIPRGPVSGSHDFNPASYVAWATVPEPAVLGTPVLSGKRLVQEAAGFKVTSAPCASGYLFSTNCAVIMT